MKRFGTLALMAISGAAFGGPSVVSPGSSLVTGSAANKMALFGAHGNPAAGNLVVAPDESWRLNYLPTLAVGAEVGAVDSFTDDLDELIDILDEPESADEPVQDVLDRFNDTLVVMGEEGYLKVNAVLHAPLTPLHWRPDFMQGTFTLDLSASAQARLSVLDDELSFQNGRFETSTAAYIKSGIEKKAALGYSRPVFTSESEGGELTAGVRASFINMELSKQVYLLQLLDGRDIGDVIKDEYDQNLVSSNGVAIDVGLLWHTEKYSAGLTVSNVNEPSFEYGAVGMNCDALEDGSDELSNCRAAAHFADTRGDLKTQETHTKFAVATVDGSYSLRSNWLLLASYDLAEYSDFVGDEYQWANIATAYYPETQFLPDLRFGYKKNMVGSGLASFAAGVSFGPLTLNGEWSTETVTIDGSETPRSFALSIGFEESF